MSPYSFPLPRVELRPESTETPAAVLAHKVNYTISDDRTGDAAEETRRLLAILTKDHGELRLHIHTRPGEDTNAADQPPGFNSSHVPDIDFSLDFSKLDSTDVLENFDFDSFLNTDGDSAFNFDGMSGGSAFNFDGIPPTSSS